MNKFTTSALALSFLIVGSTHAVVLTLDLPSAGYYSDSGLSTVVIDGSDPENIVYLDVSTATTVTSSTSFGGATFDIVYTIGSTATAANSFVRSTGSQLGVGSDGDISNHYSTLEGNDGEGISFTGLAVANFVAGASGLTVEDITDLTFTGVTFNNVANNQDGVNISFTDFGLSTQNQNLNSANTGGTPYTMVLSSYSNYTAPETAVYFTTDNTASSNRWAITGIDVSYAIPEPGSFALSAGLLGLFTVMLRRRKA